MDDTPGPAVETIGLCETFGDVVAVDGLDLRVEAGSFFGFLGPNGAGKSTTITILTGMLLPTSGNASILGHDVVDDAVAAKQITGAVSEGGALFERLSGAALSESASLHRNPLCGCLRSGRRESEFRWRRARVLPQSRLSIRISPQPGCRWRSRQAPRRLSSPR